MGWAGGKGRPGSAAPEIHRYTRTPPTTHPPTHQPVSSLSTLRYSLRWGQRKQHVLINRGCKHRWHDTKRDRPQAWVPEASV